MPMYEFKCPNCEQKITELCRMGESGETLTCSACGHSGLKKMISGFASPGVAGESGGGACAPGCAGNCAGCH